MTGFFFCSVFRFLPLLPSIAGTAAAAGAGDDGTATATATSSLKSLTLGMSFNLCWAVQWHRLFGGLCYDMNSHIHTQHTFNNINAHAYAHARISFGFCLSLS